MRRYFLLTLLLSGLFLLGWADRIDPKVAQEIAKTVANDYTNGSLRSSSQTVSLVYAAAAGQKGTDLRSNGASQEVDYYVFNIGAQQGFVIVSGDDRAHPVLGYAEKGSFDPDNLPANLRGMLSQYQKEIGYAVQQDITATDGVRTEWSRLTSGLPLRSSGETVLLETAKWDQGAPYNSHTPLMGTEHALTGCVATS